MSIILSIDVSTAEPSVALMDDQQLIATRRWTSVRGDASKLLREIQTLTVDNDVALDSISLYATGLGPGGFTGLRISITAILALALPGETPVEGICSADAIAFAVQREYHTDSPIMIVGDARRDRLWIISPTPSATNKLPEIRVIPTRDAAQLMVTIPGIIIATPDWLRLASTLESIVPSSATLVRHPCIPEAADIGRLALQRRASGVASPPIDPMYVHPPVFVAPTFTRSAIDHPARTP